MKFAILYIKFLGTFKMFPMRLQNWLFFIRILRRFLILGISAFKMIESDSKNRNILLERSTGRTKR